VPNEVAPALLRAAGGHERSRNLTLTSGFVGEAFRFVDLGPQDPFQAFGRMPVLGTNVHEGKGSIMTTSVWGATHLNVGWFDDVDATLDLDKCRELGVQVIRRPVDRKSTRLNSSH